MEASIGGTMRYIINDDDLEDWVTKLKEVKKHLNEILELDLAGKVEYVEEEMEAYIADKKQEERWKDLN